jgi:Lrp/AsnC family transcriptional regulator, leucine-responsive regulatory protein
MRRRCLTVTPDATQTQPRAHSRNTVHPEGAFGSVSCVAPPPDIDAIDHRILDLLGSDARRTLADIGSHVSLSASAVKRRIDRLEASGVITGYRAVVDRSKLGQQLEAFAELTFAGDTKVADIASAAEGLPGVQAVFTTAGDPDALVWIRVRDMADLTRVIDLLRRSGRVTSTKTLMVLDTWTGGSTSS